ncbi:MAG: superoxide dismutase [Desulfobacterales bacterium]|jgi:Fe-Mn family superoxide dismutase
MDRRAFLKLAAGAGALAFVQAAGIGCSRREQPRVVLPDLPYPADGLEPYISKRTVSFHHGRHQRGYVEKTLLLASGSRYGEMTLSDIVVNSAADPDARALFNVSAQAWNHQFYWKSMKPGGGGPPAGSVGDRIQSRFGDYARFADAFVKAGTDHFASGWLWLVQDRDTVGILTTADADTVITGPLRPLLAVDLWEHAYYLDYQDRREDYLRAVVSHLVNWDFAEENMSG